MVTRSKIDFRLGLRVTLPRTLDKGRREVQTFGSGCCQQRLRDITKSRRSASRVRPRLPHRTPPCDTHHHQVKILVVIIERSNYPRPDCATHHQHACQTCEMFLSARVGLCVRGGQFNFLLDLRLCCMAIVDSCSEGRGEHLRHRVRAGRHGVEGFSGQPD